MCLPFTTWGPVHGASRPFGWKMQQRYFCGEKIWHVAALGFGRPSQNRKLVLSVATPKSDTRAVSLPLTCAIEDPAEEIRGQHHSGNFQGKARLARYADDRKD